MDDLLRELGRRVRAAGGEAYFVGGCVRDHLLGEATNDIDFALAGAPFGVGRALTRACGGHVFWLREEDEVARVLLPAHGVQIDLCRMQGGSIQEDLRARDLTVNAMASPGEQGLAPGCDILDPCGGRRDLEARVIRFVSPSAPERDPLRSLRALRFRWKLGFELAAGTEERVRRCVPLLARVSGERVRDELFQLLEMPSAPDALAECFAAGMGGRLTGVDVAGVEPAERVRAMLAILARVPEEAARLLETQPTAGRRRRELLLWAAALQPLAPPATVAQAARCVALSGGERRLLGKGLAGATAAASLCAGWPVPGRERRRFLRETHPAEPEAVLLAGVADDWTAAHDALLREAIEHHLRPPEPLLTGFDVMRLLDVPPGPAVGEWIEAVEEARADGVVTTRDEAAAWLRASRARQGE